MDILNKGISSHSNKSLDEPKKTDPSLEQLSKKQSEKKDNLDPNTSRELGKIKLSKSISDLSTFKPDENQKSGITGFYDGISSNRAASEESIQDITSDFSGDTVSFDEVSEESGLQSKSDDNLGESIQDITSDFSDNTVSSDGTYEESAFDDDTVSFDGTYYESDFDDDTVSFDGTYYESDFEDDTVSSNIKPKKTFSDLVGPELSKIKTVRDILDFEEAINNCESLDLNQENYLHNKAISKLKIIAKIPNQAEIMSLPLLRDLHDEKTAKKVYKIVLNTLSNHLQKALTLEEMIIAKQQMQEHHYHHLTLKQKHSVNNHLISRLKIISKNPNQAQLITLPLLWKLIVNRKIVHEIHHTAVNKKFTTQLKKSSTIKEMISFKLQMNKHSNANALTSKEKKYFDNHVISRLKTIAKNPSEAELINPGLIARLITPGPFSFKKLTNNNKTIIKNIIKITKNTFDKDTFNQVKLESKKICDKSVLDDINDYLQESTTFTPKQKHTLYKILRLRLKDIAKDPTQAPSLAAEAPLIELLKELEGDEKTAIKIHKIAMNTIKVANDTDEYLAQQKSTGQEN